jgi:hypothetical protein
MKSATRTPSALYCFTLSQAAADALSECGPDQARTVLRGLEKAWSANGVFVTDRGRQHWLELLRVAGLPGEGARRLLLHFLESGPVAELARWPECPDVAAASREMSEPEGGTWFVSEAEYDRMDVREEQELLAESRCNDKDVEFCRLMTFSDTRWDSGHASLDLEADAPWSPFVDSLLPMVGAAKTLTIIDRYAGKDLAGPAEDSGVMTFLTALLGQPSRFVRRLEHLNLFVASGVAKVTNQPKKGVLETAEIVAQVQALAPALKALGLRSLRLCVSPDETYRDHVHGRYLEFSGGSLMRQARVLGLSHGLAVVRPDGLLRSELVAGVEPQISLDGRRRELEESALWQGTIYTDEWPR